MNYINLTGTTHSIQGARTLNLKNLSDADARALLLNGSHHISISDAGKRKLFKAKEVIELIETASTREKVVYYASLSSYASVEAAAEKKLEQFGDEQA